MMDEIWVIKGPWGSYSAIYEPYRTGAIRMACLIMDQKCYEISLKKPHDKILFGRHERLCPEEKRTWARLKARGFSVVRAQLEEVA